MIVLTDICVLIILSQPPCYGHSSLISGPLLYTVVVIAGFLIIGCLFQSQGFPNRVTLLGVCFRIANLWGFLIELLYWVSVLELPISGIS